MKQITLKNINKKIDNNPILKNVNISINEGSLVFIKGKNGSGKTSLIKILSLINKPDSGHLLIDNLDVSILKKKQIKYIRKQEISVIEEDTTLIDELSIYDNIRISKLLTKNNFNIKKALSYFFKKDILKKLPKDLSYSEKKIIILIRALAKKPKLLLCDTSFEGLDQKCINKILKLFKDIINKEKAIIIITGYNNLFSKNCDVLIDLGKQKK